MVTAVAWAPDSQLVSCSDDKSLCKWSAEGEHVGNKITIDVYISHISWFPTVGKQSADMFAAACTDGTFRFFTRSGREEKKIKAHEGAVISVAWSHDGSTLLSAGEDGEVKIWSRSGNLRSVLASTGNSVYCCCWGPDDDQVAIGCGKTIMVKTVQVNRKNLQWNAHEGIVTCVDWNITNQNIVSGGEDCVFHVFDSFGRVLYTSKPLEHVITSISWSPNGEVFAVGSFNNIRLCDKTGWTHSKHRVASGSLMDMSWTSDGTQFAAAGGNGSVVFAQVVNRRLEWKNTEILLVEPRKISVQDAALETMEDLEFPRDRVVEVGIGFDMLIVATTQQCYVYNVQNLNTPIIFDIKAPPHFLHLCRKHFLTLDLVTGIQVISYEGRVASNLRFQGLRPEYLSKDMISLSPDMVCIVDTVDKKLVHIMDPLSGRLFSKLTHSCEVQNLCLNQHSLGTQDRLLAFTDKNNDLFVAALGGVTSGQSSSNTPTFKLHGHIDSFQLNDETDVLVALSDGQLHAWYHPGAPFVDKDLLPLTHMVIDGAEAGRNAQIVAYTGTRISVRKVDGSVIFSSTSVDIDLLYELSRAGKWDESLRLCRHQKSQHLYATLAAMALAKKQLETVEMCLAQLNEVAKVEYIQYIKDIPSEEGRQAELALYRRQPNEAERILLQATPPLVYRAVMMNIHLYRWTRALDIAVKYRSHVDTCLGYRQKFLEQFSRRETEQKFLQYANQVTVDWDAIKAKKHSELEDERGRSGGSSMRK